MQHAITWRNMLVMWLCSL